MKSITAEAAEILEYTKERVDPYKIGRSQETGLTSHILNSQYSVDEIS